MFSFKPTQQVLLVVLLFCGLASILASSFGDSGKWLTSAGLLLDISGIVQFEISGLFDKVLEKYGNEEDYPHGPPSHITRRIIDNPDTPIRTWIAHTVFFSHKAGFYLIMAGFAFQLVGVWAKPLGPM